MSEDWLAAFNELAKDHPIVRKAKDFEEGLVIWSGKDQDELERVLTCHGMDLRVLGFTGISGDDIGEGRLGIDLPGSKCEVCQTTLLPQPEASLWYDDEGGRFTYPDSKDVVIGVGGTDQIKIKPGGKVKKVFLEGVVVDPVLDCHHMTVSNGDHDGLHDILSDLEGKKVKIMIEVVEDDDGL